MQPGIRIFMFDLLRRGDCFSQHVRRPSLSVGYHAQKSMGLWDHTQMERSHKRDKYLIVGLGNFDRQTTRHSVGMQVVDRLAVCLHTCFHREKNCSGCIATATLNGVDIILLKPKMPMNVNGTSVRKTATSYNIRPENVYLLHDDIDKSVGHLSVKEKGSANGHNGVRSVIDSLHSNAMPRIKIGIDRPASRDQVADYVLSQFPSEEQQVINKVVKQSLVKIADHIGKRTGEDIRGILQLDIEELREKDKKQSAG